MLFAIVATFGWFVSACDPGSDVTYVNDTNLEIDICRGVDDEQLRFSVKLLPRSSRQLGYLEHSWEGPVAGFDDQNRLLFLRDIPWDELEDHDFRIVITADDLNKNPPRPGSVECTGRTD